MNNIISIVVALEKEAQPLVSKIDKKVESTLSGKKIFCGTIEGKNVCLIVSGIGKVSAAIATQAVIAKFNPSAIINFGTVGGVKNDVSAKKYYAIDKCCQYDFDLSDLDDVPIGYIQDYNCVFFNVNSNAIDFLEKRSLATSDRFTCKQRDVDTVLSLDCSVCDMEGAAIAQTCLSNNLPLYIIKGVTDVCGSGTNANQFNENLKAVSSGFTDVIIKLIKTL